MNIYLLGIAGTGMGSFAGLLRAAGHQVSGSDENVYPPMSDKLREWGIEFFMPYAKENLYRQGKPPELAVVGNVIRAGNVEAAELRRKGIPHVSFPEALEELFLLERHSVVIAGTHGKTTTTSLLAWTLQSAGRDPSLLVGGVPLNFNEGFRLGKGAHFVVEGDEYDTAYFDKGPKFMHYRPRTAIFTGAEFDHADIYKDMDAYEAAFEKFFALIPQDGFAAACAGFANWKKLTQAGKCKIESYRGVEDGRGADGSELDWSIRGLTLSPEGARFEPMFHGKSEGSLTLTAAGRHNVENGLGVYAALRSLGLTHAELNQGFSSFRGVKRRQELRGVARGVYVIDDFAHHPTAVLETIAAIKAQYKGHRVVAIFEPRSNTAMRKIHQDEYAHAFRDADEAIISQPSALAKVPEHERVDAKKMVDDIAASGTRARWFPSADAIVEGIRGELKEGDVVLAMSNGAFGGIHDKLLAALK